MSLLGQYKYVLNKSHPRANSEGAVYEHIIVAEKKIGRNLLPEEVVHHRDLNKLNNDPNNIMVFATHGDHARFHKRGCKESILQLNSNNAYVCPEKKFVCVDCGTEITKYAIRCKSCCEKQKIHTRKVKRPDSDTLLNMLLEYKGNFTKIGKNYGVTDNAVRKWCDSYGLPRKSREYKQ